MTASTRRTFVSGSLALLASARAVGAQDRGWRVGYLSTSLPQTDAAWLAGFERALRDLGYVEGRNVVIAFGSDLREQYRLGADLVDKILKGAKPVDLPIEQPRKFELVINMKPAKALGLKVPPSVLLRAAQVIE